MSHKTGEITSRSSKPLCLNNLSALVLKFLKKNQTTTFSKVADMVIHEISQTYGDVSVDKTTRRRVYDVLNVFLASGLITKEGKTIQFHQNSKNGISLNNENSNDNELSNEDEELMAINNEKKQQLISKIKLYLTYRSLILRNHSILKPPNAIHLPAIIIGFNSSLEDISQRYQNGHTLEIQTTDNPIFYSPNDIFKTMSFPIESQRQIFKELKGFEKIEKEVFDVNES